MKIKCLRNTPQTNPYDSLILKFNKTQIPSLLPSPSKRKESTYELYEHKYLTLCEL